MPKDFASALAKLQDLKASIADAYAKEDPHLAHDALHEIGHVIETLPELAKEAGLSEEAQAAVVSASENLMDAYAALDEGMHGGEEIGYDEVEQKIQDAMASLSSADDSQE